MGYIDREIERLRKENRRLLERKLRREAEIRRLLTGWAGVLIRNPRKGGEK